MFDMMEHMKTVLLIPGFGEDINSRNYVATINAIKKKGYVVIFIGIHWSRTTIEQWVPEFNAVYKEYDPRDTIIAGFSYGAMTAFMTAVDRSPSELWLFSLSPYFKEDIEGDDMKKSWLSQIGHRRVTAFRALPFVGLQKKLTTKTLYFYGEQELKVWPDITYRERAIEGNEHTEVIIVKDAGHDITNSHYIQAIVDTIE